MTTAFIPIPSEDDFQVNIKDLTDYYLKTAAALDQMPGPIRKHLESCLRAIRLLAYSKQVIGYMHKEETRPGVQEQSMKLQLDPYEITNLRWLLVMTYNCSAMYSDRKGMGHVLNTGDWCGQIRWAVEQLMLDHNISLLPNAVTQQGNELQWPKLIGLCNGMTTDEFNRYIREREGQGSQP